MISDATGETLITIAKAVRVQYAQVRAIEHLHPLVRSRRELERVLKDVEAAPGIVLYTLFNRELAEELERSCKRLNIPCVPALKPILQVFESYLGTPATPTVGGQHVLDADYFRRIEALNFTMLHDDWAPAAEPQRRRHHSDRHQPDLKDADLDLSRQSRLQDRQCATGARRAAPPQLEVPSHAFVVGLVASTERIAQVRQNRVIEHAHGHLEDYVDREAIAAEITQTRALCARHGWPIIDVTRRSIEETAAAILRLYHDREAPVLEA
jgi:regulator of PEP synthase PpsR (kinase-PPPase family)